MDQVNVVGNRYTCDATVINSGSGILESITGVHETEKNNDDVGQLYINQQYLTSIPEGIAEFFKYLDVIWIHYSSLMSISANDLRPFPRLLFIRLWGNQLMSIDGDLFKYTPQLRFVSFYLNRIEHIGHNLVTNLGNLTSLYFNQNVCINQSAVTRAQVLSLAPQLSVLCPPLDVTVTEATTTTEIILDQCLCDEEIRSLGNQVDSQNKKIEQQSEEIEQLEKRLLEIEMKLLEIGSMPCSK